MNPAFEKLPKEKKERILRVSLEEFAVHGYRNASTNRITRRAGISKGLLFHYFGNKKNLYLYLLDYAVDCLFEKTMQSIQAADVEEGTDFFEVVKRFVLIKLETALQYPKECQFVLKAIDDPPDELKHDIAALIARKQETLKPLSDEYIYRFLDENRLRPHIPREKAVEITRFLFDQLGQKYGKLYQGRQEELLKHPEPLLKDLDLYMDVLKYGLYRQPG